MMEDMQTHMQTGHTAYRQQPRLTGLLQAKQ